MKENVRYFANRMRSFAVHGQKFPKCSLELAPISPMISIGDYASQEKRSPSLKAV
jgi:hypothetical protein